MEDQNKTQESTVRDNNATPQPPVVRQQTMFNLDLRMAFNLKTVNGKHHITMEMDKNTPVPVILFAIEQIRNSVYGLIANKTQEEVINLKLADILLQPVQVQPEVKKEGEQSS